MRKTVWTIDSIRSGIEAYFASHGRYPTANDFDEVPYLPSARQVQRKFGGVEALRSTLGMTETNYTKGQLRTAVYGDFSQRSLEAEDNLEMELIKYFGEPYVHTQKRYYRLMKNRWDFFVYHQGGYFGVDIFSTARKVHIMNNVRHKLAKYIDVPISTPIYFVVDAPQLSDQDILDATQNSKVLMARPNIMVVSYSHFLKIVHDIEPLALPANIALVLDK